MCEFYFLNVDKIGSVNWNLTSEKHEENRHENHEYWTPIFICSNSGKLNLSTFWLRTVWIFVVQRFFSRYITRFQMQRCNEVHAVFKKLIFQVTQWKTVFEGRPIIHVIFMRLFKLFMSVEVFFLLKPSTLDFEQKRSFRCVTYCDNKFLVTSEQRFFCWRAQTCCSIVLWGEVNKCWRFQVFQSVEFRPV